MMIFGAGGDLTKRLVVPALYNLVRAGKLPDDFAIIGVDHNDRDHRGVAPEPDRDDAGVHASAGTSSIARSTSRPGHGSPAACTICAETLCSLRPIGQLAKLLAERRAADQYGQRACSIWRSPTGSSAR